MSFDEDRRAAAIRALPAMHRTLFLLHDFYDVDTPVIAGRLDVSEEIVAATLGAARRSIHSHWPTFPEHPVNDSDPAPIEALEQRLRGDYRASLQATFVECGYSGRVAWPAEASGIADDEEAAARFVVSYLHPSLRKAVKRSAPAKARTVDLWKVTRRWQRLRRDRLHEVRREISCAGWQTFEEWLADRIAPERYYPSGVISRQRLRSPLPEEPDPTDSGLWVPHWPDDPERQERFDRLPLVTRHVYGLFEMSGRNTHEIARRLGIGRRAADTQIYRAIYAVMGLSYPNLWWTIILGFDRWCDKRTHQLRRIWAIVRE